MREEAGIPGDASYWVHGLASYSPRGSANERTARVWAKRARDGIRELYTMSRRWKPPPPGLRN